MATENRALAQAIAEARDFEPERYPGGLMMAFFRLMDVPQDEAPALWAELRRRFGKIRTRGIRTFAPFWNARTWPRAATGGSIQTNGDC